MKLKIWDIPAHGPLTKVEIIVMRLLPERRRLSLSMACVGSSVHSVGVDMLGVVEGGIRPH